METGRSSIDSVLRQRKVSISWVYMANKCHLYRKIVWTSGPTLRGHSLLVIGISVHYHCWPGSPGNRWPAWPALFSGGCYICVPHSSDFSWCLEIIIHVLIGYTVIHIYRKELKSDSRPIKKVIVTTFLWFILVGIEYISHFTFYHHVWWRSNPFYLFFLNLFVWLLKCLSVTCKTSSIKHCDATSLYKVPPVDGRKPWWWGLDNTQQ